MKKVESIKPTGVLADMIEDFKRDLLLKDLAARIPYGVNVKTPYNDARLIGIIKRKGSNCVDYVDVLTDKQTYPIRYIQPYLRSMSSMTEEEKEELSPYMEEYPLKNVNYPLETEQWTMTHLIPEVIDFYYSHHIDFRNLIPLQKALEAPEGMYNV